MILVLNFDEHALKKFEIIWQSLNLSQQHASFGVD